MISKEIRESLKLVPTFIKMCENDLGEADHRIEKPLTCKEYEKIQKLISKLKYLDNYVDTNIFK